MQILQIPSAWELTTPAAHQSQRSTFFEWPRWNTRKPTIMRQRLSLRDPAPKLERVHSSMVRLLYSVVNLYNYTVVKNRYFSWCLHDTFNYSPELVQLHLILEFIHYAATNACSLVPRVLWYNIKQYIAAVKLSQSTCRLHGCQ